MPSKEHEKKIEYIKEHFDELTNPIKNKIPSNYRPLEVIGLETELIRISKKNKGVRPDILMIERIPVQDPEPMQIEVNWCEVMDTSFRGFPEKAHVRKALEQVLTVGEVYGQEEWRAAFGLKAQTTKKARDFFRKRFPHILLFYYLVLGSGIYRCDPINVLPENLEVIDK